MRTSSSHPVAKEALLSFIEHMAHEHEISIFERDPLDLLPQVRIKGLEAYDDTVRLSCICNVNFTCEESGFEAAEKQFDQFCEQHNVGQYKDWLFQARFVEVFRDLIARAFDEAEVKTGNAYPFETFMDLCRSVGWGQDLPYFTFGAGCAKANRVDALVYGCLYLMDESEFALLYDGLQEECLKAPADRETETELLDYLQPCFRRAAAHHLGWNGKEADIIGNDKMYQIWQDVHRHPAEATKRYVNNAWRKHVNGQAGLLTPKIDGYYVESPTDSASLILQESIYVGLAHRVLSLVR